MGACSLLALSSSYLLLRLLLLSLARAQEDELREFKHLRPKLSAMGVVYCDQCYHGLRDTNTVPLRDVEVRVKCRDLYGFVTFSAVGFTNEHGAFSIPMDDIPSIFGIQGCRASLVRSMNEHCDVVSNVGGGHSGAPLVLKSKSLKHVVFTTGPFAYHPFTPPSTCHQFTHPLHPPLDMVGNNSYASPESPPPTPLMKHGTYYYVSPPPPPPPPPSSPSPSSPSPPSPPPPPPPYWYRSPPPSPYYWYKSPPPPFIQTHSPPPLIQAHPPPLFSPTTHPPYFAFHHFHHDHFPPPPPPRYYYASPPPLPIHSPPPPPYLYQTPLPSSPSPYYKVLPPPKHLQRSPPPSPSHTFLRTPPPLLYKHESHPPLSHEHTPPPKVPHHNFESPPYGQPYNYHKAPPMPATHAHPLGTYTLGNPTPHSRFIPPTSISPPPPNY